MDCVLKIAVPGVLHRRVEGDEQLSAALGDLRARQFRDPREDLLRGVSEGVRGVPGREQSQRHLQAGRLRFAHGVAVGRHGRTGSVRRGVPHRRVDDRHLHMSMADR